MLTMSPPPVNSLASGLAFRHLVPDGSVHRAFIARASRSQPISVSGDAICTRVGNVACPRGGTLFTGTNASLQVSGGAEKLRAHALMKPAQGLRLCGSGTGRSPAPVPSRSQGVSPVQGGSNRPTRERWIGHGRSTRVASSPLPKTTFASDHAVGRSRPHLS